MAARVSPTRENTSGSWDVSGAREAPGIADAAIMSAAPAAGPHAGLRDTMRADMMHLIGAR
jgi:hypothetical protein